jgi:hypothetical protein
MVIMLLVANACTSQLADGLWLLLWLLTVSPDCDRVLQHNPVFSALLQSGASLMDDDGLDYIISCLLHRSQWMAPLNNICC